MAVNVGDAAPDFELPSHHGKGKKVRLSDFRGKKNVLIAFYPLAWTPVWTVQMPSYEADIGRFERADTHVLGISVDSVPCNAAWAKSLGGITYDLLSDFEPKGEVARRYGAYRPEGYAERALFIVDKQGKIIYKDIHKIDEQPDNEDIFKALRKAAWVAAISRRCVPFTPFEGGLGAATVALVTAGGVHCRDQPPFNIADDLGDETFRVIPGDVDAAELMVTHHHYDHADADRDINVQFPIERLRELVAEKLIGAVAAAHVGFMGYTMQLRKMYEETAPAIADHIDRHARPDAVVLTGGWPQVCHRTVVAVQRELELRGMSTVLITVSPEASRQMRPPRAFHPRGFKVGNALGRPFMRELQRRVLLDALGLLTAPPRPGEIVEREYPEG